MTETNIIKLRGVEKRYGSFTAATGINLELKEGEFFSLLGPSGCGKTTVLRMIAGFQEPSEGHIEIDGVSMDGVPANKRPTNMVFQSYAIFPHLNVGDNVAYGLRGRVAKPEIEERVAEALEMVELGGLQKRGATELSGGQRQRVALARALIMRPKVLLLDEPLSALDKKLREQMQFEMRNLQQSLGITFVMVTHDQYEAMTMSDRIGVMFQGRLMQVDTPTMLYARPCNREIASFIGEMNILPAAVQNEQAETSMTVDMAAFGKIEIEKNPNVTNRAKNIIVGIRPEQLEISPDKPADYPATLQGTVSNVAFYGENVHYHVKTETFEKPISVSVPNYFHTVDFQRDDKVWLGVQGASVIDLGQDKQ
ncbi:Spermidine/putrescine import ATP-binding protein PotA [Roseovarius albus]|uniref:Spermidine/putrescine import ATP-binding protein PotA n=1 Tax=Roseovarius albus TaxID=1247867 RepID=A0A1X6ZMZ7_9RHOB|nr:ABC transporter ATP-binding protein [Roseovarius albus]SLN56187.1 Spermidine/putrescine import ATP-binding protein PotA [Roseovarius albus]